MDSNNALAHRLENVDDVVKEHTQFVVMHGGNLDLPIDNEEQMETLVNCYALEVHTVLDKCPNAEVIISSVPPRSGPEREGINDMIQSLNKKLEKFCEDEDKAYYANNYPYLTNDGVVMTGFYDPHDESGVHLNDEGQNEMAKAIMKEINIAYHPDKRVRIS